MSENFFSTSPETSAIPAPKTSKVTAPWNRIILKAIFWLGICLDIFMLCSLSYLVVMRSSYFNLNNVDVYGNHRLSTEDVIEASNIKTGINLLNIDLEAITQKLRRNPWIREGSVYRRFPGQLVIEIEERIPRGILACDKLYYIDEKGEIFTRARPGDPMDLPLFTGLRPEDLRLEPGEVQESLLSGLKITDLLERSDSELDIKNVREININLEDGLTLIMASGRIIVLGRSDFETKINRYERLRKFLIEKGQWRKARIINLDFEDRAIVRSSDSPLPQG